MRKAGHDHTLEFKEGRERLLLLNADFNKKIARHLNGNKHRFSSLPASAAPLTPFGVNKLQPARARVRQPLHDPCSHTLSMSNVAADLHPRASLHVSATERAPIPNLQQERIDCIGVHPAVVKVQCATVTGREISMARKKP